MCHWCLLCFWLMVLPRWLMLLPYSWCYCHCFVLFVLGRCYSLVADVIATIVVILYWQMLLPGGWWNCLLLVWMADGIAMGQCFNFNSDVLCKFSSHMCGRWYLLYLNQNPSRNKNRISNNQTGQKTNTNKNICMVVPNQQGLSERVKNTCQKYGIQVHFKGGQTIKDLFMAPKDKDTITNKSGVMYRYKCSEDGCEEEYIGESARTFAERF